MKKTFLVLLITLLATAVFAIPAGTFNLGGTAGFNSYKINKDAKAENEITFSPNIGYFFMDNLSADLLVDYSYLNSGKNNSTTDIGLGLGARYFYGIGDFKLYGGFGGTYKSFSSKLGSSKITSTGVYLNPKLGILLPMSEDVYLDLGAKYDIGVGDNEDSTLGINLGLQIFMPLCSGSCPFRRNK